MADWTTYILRCADDSLYTGITTDLARRLEEHNSDNRQGAAYTRGRRPVRVIYQESHASRSAATSREAEIKRLSRAEKEQMIQQEA